MKKFIVVCLPIPDAEYALSQKEVKVKAKNKEDAQREVESKNENRLYQIDEIIELAS